MGPILPQKFTEMTPHIVDTLNLIHKGLHDIRLTTEGSLTYGDLNEDCRKSYIAPLSRRQVNRFLISNGAPIESRLVLSPAETRYAVYTALMNSFQLETSEKQTILHEKILHSKKAGWHVLHPVEKNFIREINNVQDLFHKNMTILMLSGQNKSPSSSLNGETLEKALHHYRAAMKALNRRCQWAFHKMEAIGTQPA